ncbi:MAG TPA: SGNH/GDSL hydrolase family protein [Blastocatellia bacterium]|nr:SGNH/GDSL hydrolase family protein [Blastocatellia bacterium]
MKNRFIKILLGLSALVALGCLVAARSPQDCASVTAALEQRLEAQRHLLVDWAGLTRYGSENTELPRPAPSEDRVVFLGDEITENWGRGGAKFFPGRPWLNRGIAGQTTPQLLVRFRQDVIALKPKVVVILAGSNDVASLTAPITQAMTAENIMSIVELARANNIRVVLASLTPINDHHTRQSLVRPFGKIIGLNNWLKEYAAQSGSVWLDYYSAMAEGRNLKKELTDDGLLPNDAGYAVMAPLAEAAIAQALGKR